VLVTFLGKPKQQVVRTVVDKKKDYKDKDYLPFGLELLIL